MRARTLSRSAHRRALYALGLLLLFACSGCAVFGMGDAQVSFFSEPPGAKVIVDREDTGFVTPCRITLASRDEHKVELELPGYTTARLDLDPKIDHDTILWKDMSLAFGSYGNPLWLNFKDSITPVKLYANLSPGRVFVQLQRDIPQ